MPLPQGRLAEAQCSDRCSGSVGGSMDDNGEFHFKAGPWDELLSRNKKPRKTGLFNNRRSIVLLATGQRSQQVQQMDKNIEDAEVQRNRCHDVVGFTTGNNPAGIKQDET